MNGGKQVDKRLVAEKIPPADFNMVKSLCAARDVSMADMIRALFHKLAEGDTSLLDRICK